VHLERECAQSRSSSVSVREPVELSFFWRGGCGAWWVLRAAPAPRNGPRNEANDEVRTD
jgi:hypothetical protein